MGFFNHIFSTQFYFGHDCSMDKDLLKVIVSFVKELSILQIIKGNLFFNFIDSTQYLREEFNFQVLVQFPLLKCYCLKNQSMAQLIYLQICCGFIDSLRSILCFKSFDCLTMVISIYIQTLVKQLFSQYIDSYSNMELEDYPAFSKINSLDLN